VLGGRGLAIESATVEQTKDDDGNSPSRVDNKVDPTYPKTDASGMISETAYGVSPATDTLAGDDRGRNVVGFTFASEYIQGGSFQVKKLYDGDHSDRTRYSSVELTIHSAAAAHASGSGNVLTYRVLGDGVDTTSNVDGNGDHLRLNGVYDIPQANDYMVEFDPDGWAYITANLKEDSVISITGMFGPYDSGYESESPNGKDRRETFFTGGIMEGLDYYVIEREPYDYRPTGYVYVGDDDQADPRVNKTGMQETPYFPDPDNPDPTPVANDLGPFSLCVSGTTSGSATTVFVVNAMDENKVSVTGILIDNMPYILMIGIPVTVFAAWFALRRRGVAAE
jgi:hypothetical protein